MRRLIQHSNTLNTHINVKSVPEVNNMWQALCTNAKMHCEVCNIGHIF